jgi:uncharacterized membrane protein
VSAAAGAPSFSRRAAWIATAGLALAMAGYAASYLVVGERITPEVLVESFRARPWGIASHVLFGAPALAIGPFQFLSGSWARRPRLHRVLGRIAVVSALLTGASGLVMSLFAYSGTAAGAGFGLLGAATIAGHLVAWRAIRAREVQRHREWMVRSYSLLFAAVTFRAWLGILAATLPDFRVAYAGAAWLCWVPNLAFAEWLVRRSRAVPAPRLA